ncbi:lysosomal thioesterase PPT2-A-like [Argopecten irradians]|uniref:lysosomal thioesterase PPT2-A-like n=1 Tax=Argopecten irradians TaxID=31199 RepID=UPI0037120C9D
MTYLLFMTLFHAFSVCLCYKPVIYMHGILASADEIKPLAGFIEKFHPGTNVTTIDAFNGYQSLQPLWTQVYKIQGMVLEIMKDHPKGVHLICFSQGGIICRGLLSVTRHNVDTFISLSSPQAGQYGDTAYLRYLFPHFIKEELYRYFYTSSGQHWSVANYWHDPHHEELYRNQSVFLALLDNDTNSAQNTEYKKNFLRLKNLVLIGGPHDQVITPWQSSQFGFYNGSEGILEMRQQRFYLQDSFGLRTLDQRKAIHTYTIPGIEHVMWYRDQKVFDCCIKPWLT